MFPDSIMIPKAYTVGYLATLNTRVHLRRDQTASASGGKGDQTVSLSPTSE